MMILITYDISMQTNDGKRRLRYIAKECVNYGVRVQYSVFECDIMPDQWVRLKAKLLEIYNPNEDSLRFYKLGKNWRNRVEHHGAKPATDLFQDILII